MKSNVLQTFYCRSQRQVEFSCAEAIGGTEILRAEDDAAGATDRGSQVGSNDEDHCSQVGEKHPGLKCSQLMCLSMKCAVVSCMTEPELVQAGAFMPKNCSGALDRRGPKNQRGS